MTPITFKKTQEVILKMIKIRLSPETDGYKCDITISVQDLDGFNESDAFAQLLDILKKIKQDNEYDGITKIPVFENSIADNENKKVLIKGSTTRKLVLYAIQRLIKGKKNLFTKLSDEEYKDVLPYLNEFSDKYDSSGDRRFKIKSINKGKAPRMDKIKGLPENFSWEDVELKFIDKTQLEIYVHNKFITKTNSKEFGFCKEYSKLKEQELKAWEFLSLLSKAGIISNPASTVPAFIPTVENMAREIYKGEVKKNIINSCEKLKGQVAKNLQDAFGLVEKPFYDYEEHNCYKPKFKILPQSILRNWGGEAFTTRHPEIDEEKTADRSSHYSDLEKEYNGLTGKE